MSLLTSTESVPVYFNREDFDSVALEVRRRIFGAVSDALGDSILLSGGLDTSIIAAAASSLLLSSERKRFQAYTVILKDSPSPDLNYSMLVSSRFRIPQQIVKVDFAELEAALPEVIKVLKSFDPMEIRNSVTVYIGLKQAKLDGWRKVMTGDGADELFAGYDFIFKLSKEKARETLIHLWQVMHFSSVPLATSLGIEAKLPFLQPEVEKFARNEIDFDFLVGSDQTNGEVFGKYILRRAFESMLPTEIVWRKKTPIEYGSGTTILPEIYSQLITEDQFLERKKKHLEEDHVKIRDKEHLKYYEIFKDLFGPPFPLDRTKRACPSCTSNVLETATFCITCGEYPI